jgi:hypothetical protein
MSTAFGQVMAVMRKPTPVVRVARQPAVMGSRNQILKAAARWNDGRARDARRLKSEHDAERHEAGALSCRMQQR